MAAAETAPSLKIGLIGLDTSHCIRFTALLNDAGDPHHVKGGRVVCAFAGGNPALPISRDRVQGFTEQLRDQYGVAIAGSIEAVAESVDALLLTSADGGQHLEQFAGLAPYGKPVFIDKPFACSLSDAQAIAESSRRSGTPVCSSSSQRFSAGIAELGAGSPVLGCLSYGPGPIIENYPGLFWYGVHSAEILFSKMGPGCRSVQVTKTELVDAVSGVWADGRVGTLYAHRLPKKARGYGATVFTAGGVVQGAAQTEPPAYALLLERLITFFRTREPAVPIEETLEIVAFLEAANASRETGLPVRLERLGPDLASA